MARLLVVDDQAIMRDSLSQLLTHCGHEVACCSSGRDALELLGERPFDLVISDLKMPGMDGIALLKEMRKRAFFLPVIMISAYGTIPTAVEAMKMGAVDFIEKPFSGEQLENLVNEALASAAVGLRRRTGAPRVEGYRALIVESAVMRRLREKVRMLASRHTTVLITGETGTGKGVVARALHYEGPRKSHPFICVNCPSLSGMLLESELFGHEKGAFTGADRMRKGRFELAGDGTILLDEISEIDLNLQAKLLRVLQERTFERVGGNETLFTNARIIATSNRDLEEEVRKHRFRSDLYFRLKVVPIHLPPLRERKEDIPALAEHFLMVYAEEYGRSPLKLSRDALKKLYEYDWPGNVRELENVIEQAYVFAEGDELGPEHVLVEQGRNRPEPTQENLFNLEEIERTTIERALEKFGGRQVDAARSLGMSTKTLRNKMKKYGIVRRVKIDRT